MSAASSLGCSHAPSQRKTRNKGTRSMKPFYRHAAVALLSSAATLLVFSAPASATSVTVSVGVSGLPSTSGGGLPSLGSLPGLPGGGGSTPSLPSLPTGSLP